MPADVITVYELYKSRLMESNSTENKVTLELYGKGSFDQAQMYDAFLASCPLTFNGILFRSLKVAPIGGRHWTATAEYSTKGSTSKVDGQGGSSTPSTPDTPGTHDALSQDYSWDINTYTEKITQSKATISKTKRNGGVAPDNKRAIGITQDGEVLGCDRISPGLEFSFTKTLGFVTLGYLEILYGLTGKVNDATFFGFPSGTVLFMGAQGRPKDTAYVSVTFKFAVNPNETDIVICDGLTVPAKKGHEFLWIGYKDVVDPVSKQLWKNPEFAYVERIYDLGNFEALGMGH